MRPDDNKMELVKKGLKRAPQPILSRGQNYVNCLTIKMDLHVAVVSECDNYIKENPIDGIDP